MRFGTFVILWFVLVALGTLVYPPIYRAYSYYADNLFAEVLIIPFNLVTQPTLAFSFLFLVFFPTIMFWLCCRVLFIYSRLTPSDKLQEMQSVFSGIGFGSFFLIFAFGLYLPSGYNRVLVILCSMLGLLVLLVTYRRNRDNLVRGHASQSPDTR
jgi:hypothetical protein